MAAEEYIARAPRLFVARGEVKVATVQAKENRKTARKGCIRCKVQRDIHVYILSSQSW